VTIKRLLLIAAVLVVLLAIGLAIAVRMLLSGDAIRSTIEQQAAATLGRPVSIQSATPRIFPRPAIHLSGISVGKDREVTIDHVALSTDLRALFGRRIEDAKLQVEGSRIDVRWALALVEGLFSEQPGTQTSAASSGISIVSVSAINLRGVELQAAGRTLRVDMESALSGSDRLTVTRFDAKSAGSDLHATGELSSLSARTGTFKIDAQSLDVDGLLAFIAATMPAGAGASPAAPPSTVAEATPLKLIINLKAKQGIAAGVNFSNLTGTCRVDGSHARLDDLGLGLFEGTFKGAVTLDGSGREPRYAWRGTFEGLDAAKVAAFAGSPGSLTGRLGGNMAIAAAGYDPRVAIRDARGTARAVITDGRIPGLEVVRGVILAFGKPTGDRPAGSGEAFSQLAATMTVGDQRLSTNDLTLTSRDFDTLGKGTLSLVSQALNFQADLVLSRELSAQAGRDLYRLAREDDRIVLPARITGTVAAPTVFIDIAEALRRAIRNKAEDQLKSLFDLMRKRVKGG
jgi:uncharacterized protein involved in outer membrane biogenesis